MKTFHESAAQSGRSMVEMLGVLAIIGVLSVGGIAGYSMAMAKFKITKTIDQAQTIITNIRTLYASQRSYSKLTPSSAYNMGVLTDETYTGSKGLNPYGGEISFDVSSDKRQFTVEYTGLTAEACLKLATADWGADASSGLVAIGVSGNGAVGDTKSFIWKDSTADDALPAKLDIAAGKCAGATNGANTSSVKWWFR